MIGDFGLARSLKIGCIHQCTSGGAFPIWQYAPEVMRDCYFRSEKTSDGYQIPVGALDGYTTKSEMWYEERDELSDKILIKSLNMSLI